MSAESSGQTHLYRSPSKAAYFFHAQCGPLLAQSGYTKLANGYPILGYEHTSGLEAWTCRLKRSPAEAGRRKANLFADL